MKCVWELSVLLLGIEVKELLDGYQQVFYLLLLSYQFFCQFTMGYESRKKILTKNLIYNLGATWKFFLNKCISYCEDLFNDMNNI